MARTLYLNADVASGPVIAHLLGEAPPGREVVLGNFRWAESLWAMQALDALPGRRALLEAVPFLLGVLTAGVLALSVRAVARSWWAAGVAAVVVVAGGPAVWSALGAWTLHGIVWLHVAVLGALVVWQTTGRRGLAAAIAAGAFTGLGVASDPLVAVAGLAPLALVAAVDRRRAIVTPIAACLAATAASAVACLLVMHAQRLRETDALPIRAAAPGRLDDNAWIVIKALADVVDGRFIGSALGPSTVLHAAAALLGLAGAVACAIWVAGRLRSREASPAERAHVVFWSSSAAALLAAVTLTTVPLDVTCSRYLLGILLALGALLPLIGSRAIVGAGVAAYALIGVMALARGEFTANGARAPERATAAAVARLAAANHVSVAYAGYWDAAPLTWSADFGVRVYPVRVCDGQGRPCPFEFHRISSWYRPRPGTRSMLVIDRTIRTISVTALDPRLGRPTAVDTVDQLEIARYGNDISAGFGPPVEGRQLPHAR